MEQLGKKPLCKNCENFRPSEKFGDWSYGTYHLCLVDGHKVPHSKCRCIIKESFKPRIS